VAGELVPRGANPTIRPTDKQPIQTVKSKRTEPRNGPSRTIKRPDESAPDRKPRKKGPVPPAPIQIVKPGKSYDLAVKIEFLAGLALFLLAPLSQKEIKFDKNYARRLIAWCVLWMLLFPMAASKNEGVARTAAWLGGLTLLTLAVLGGNPASTFGGFSVNVSKIISDVVAKLQPQK